MVTDSLTGSSAVAVVLLIIAGAVLFRKYPSSMCVFGLAVNGIGYVSIPVVGTFAKLNVLLQMIAIFVLAAMVAHRAGWRPIAEGLMCRRALFLWVLLFLWFKVGAEIAFSGLGEFRGSELSNAVLKVLLPCVILVLSCGVGRLSEVVQGCLWGMLTLGVAWLLPEVPTILLDGSAALAIYGGNRLTLYGLDTINSAQMPFITAVAALILAVEPSRRWSTRLICGGISVGAMLLVLLCGTRQFAFAYAVAVIMAALGAGRRQVAGWLTVGLVVVVLAAGLADYLRGSAFIGRVEKQKISAELEGGRGVIWREALQTGLNYPLTGVGFKNFGEVTIGYSDRTGEKNVSISNAHGFLQEILAEHGLVLCALACWGFLGTVWTGIGHMSRSSRSQIGELFTVFFILTIPNLFSGSISNATGFYFLALLPICDAVRAGRPELAMSRPSLTPRVSPRLVRQR